MNDNTTQMVKVPFYEHTMDAVSRSDGVWVGLKRMCECIGVADQRQASKLKNKPWATTTMMVAVGEDGKLREMQMLHLDSVPMWLAEVS
jgi:prophage antirepressor-like protein